MKMVKMSILAAVIAMSASAAQAFTPPYHVVSGYTGKGTLQFSGGCKAKATYENAQYGDIYDSLEANVGWGMVADGEIVVMEEGYQLVSRVVDSVTNKDIKVYYEDMASAETTDYVATKANCDIGILVSSAKSAETYTIDPAKSLNGYVAQFPFNGFTTTTSEVKGTKTYYKTLKINGKITFKGSKPLV